VGARCLALLLSAGSSQSSTPSFSSSADRLTTLQRGGEHGRDIEDWFNAEFELRMLSSEDKPGDR
jgi:hypothetical protein